MGELKPNKIIQGNCLDVLKTIPDKSINCCVTSPPYWGLRDYRTAEWEGGDKDCEHTISMPEKWNAPKRGTKYTRPEVANRGGDANACFLCGAIRKDKQLGLEETPEEYVNKLVVIFQEVWRVLKDDGVVFLNLGDSYVNAGSDSTKVGGFTGKSARQYAKTGKGGGSKQGSFDKRANGLKNKDLVGIPWRVAFTLQADGWYLRQDIIWHKPNPMPESITDRCTKSHEYIFLLSKNQKYYYDADAIKEPIKESTVERYKTGWDGDRKRGYPGASQNNFHKYMGSEKAQSVTDRNKRSVWTVNTKPYKEAHFAVFPEQLIKPCIKAGCPENGTVLDPFIGAGTTAIVAKKLHRNYLGIELNHDYIKIAEKRIKRTSKTLFAI